MISLKKQIFWILFYAPLLFWGAGVLCVEICNKNKEGGARHLISYPFPLLQFKKLFTTLSYPKLLLEPLGYGGLVDIQEQISLSVPYHLCRDVISKSIAPVIIRMQQATIIDGLPV